MTLCSTNEHITTCVVHNDTSVAPEDNVVALITKIADRVQEHRNGRVSVRDAVQRPCYVITLNPSRSQRSLPRPQAPSASHTRHSLHLPFPGRVGQ